MEFHEKFAKICFTIFKKCWRFLRHTKKKTNRERRALKKNPTKKRGPLDWARWNWSQHVEWHYEWSWTHEGVATGRWELEISSGENKNLRKKLRWIFRIFPRVKVGAKKLESRTKVIHISYGVHFQVPCTIFGGVGSLCRQTSPHYECNGISDWLKDEENPFAILVSPAFWSRRPQPRCPLCFHDFAFFRVKSILTGFVRCFFGCAKNITFLDPPRGMKFQPRGSVKLVLKFQNFGGFSFVHFGFKHFPCFDLINYLLGVASSQ